MVNLGRVCDPTHRAKFYLLQLVLPWPREVTTAIKTILYHIIFHKSNKKARFPGLRGRKWITSVRLIQIFSAILLKQWRVALIRKQLQFPDDHFPGLCGDHSQSIRLIIPVLSVRFQIIQLFYSPYLTTIKLSLIALTTFFADTICFHSPALKCKFQH